MSNAPAIPHETTLYVRDHCLCLAAQRAARALSRRFDEALRPAGLTSGQYSLLMALNRPNPPTITSVAALLAVDRTTLTANLKPLVRRGLVLMSVDAADRRGRRMALTEAGRALLVRALPIWQRTHDELDCELGEQAAAALRSGLRAVTDQA